MYPAARQRTAGCSMIANTLSRPRTCRALCRSLLHVKALQSSQPEALPSPLETLSAAFESQRQSRSSAAVYSFMIRGVSFEGRQQPLRSCHPGQAVMLIHEPSNPHDPHAKAVKTLSGTMLGYIPRDFNQSPAFRRPEGFAQIESVGPAMNTNDPELFGARVRHQPSVNPLIAQAIPRSLQTPCKELTSQLPKQKWADIAQRVLQSSHRKCSLSGLSEESLAVVPLWEEDESRQAIVLTSFVAISDALRTAQDQFLTDAAQNAPALQVYQLMNGWTQEEAKAYQDYKKAVVESRSAQEWGLDLSFLQFLQIDIPTNFENILRLPTRS